MLNLRGHPISLAGRSSASVGIYFTSLDYDLYRSQVNSQLRGSGTGRNQKVAKEEAARQAFQAMGWGSKCTTYHPRHGTKPTVAGFH